MTLAHIPEWTPRHDTSWVDLMRPAADLAVQIADTEFVPNDFRNRPGVIAACILYGAELGLGPMQSLAKIDVVKGRPAPRAELGRALAMAAGHEIWVEETTNTRVVMKGHRRGSTHIFTVTWTMDDAKKAGIAGGPGYARYPRQMLLARASAELVRQMCPDVTGGITMLAEKPPDADPDTATPPTTARTADPVRPGTQKRSRGTKTPDTPETTTDGHTAPTLAAVPTPPPDDDLLDTPAPAPPPEEEAPTEVPPTTGPPTLAPEDEPTPPRPTRQQTAKAMTLFGKLDLISRVDRLTATSAYLGKTVHSWNDLTPDEASTVIAHLEDIMGTPTPTET